MPRPRVRPENRKRAARACDPCKASKTRCDAGLPCSSCSKKGLVEVCAYPPLGRSPREATRRPSVPVHSRGWAHRRGSSSAGASSQQAEPGSGDDRPLRRVPPPATQKAVMLLSSRDEKVFVGNTAAISFLEFLQTVLGRYIGPSSFTEPGPQANRMLEIEVPETPRESFEDDLGEERKTELVRCFLEASSGLLDLFTDDEIGQLISSNAAHAGQDESCLLYLMIAIGAQCRGLHGEHMSIGAKYFSQARRMAFEGMLQDPTVNMVREFLLMAFYMFGACRRNAAFVYIGVAAKAAIVLGLQTSPSEYLHMSKEESARRYRTGKSVRVLDLISSSILGRPSSSLPLRADDIHLSDVDREPCPHRTLTLDATFESSAVLETITQRFSEQGRIDVSTAEHFLQMLQEWAQALPPPLRQGPKRPGLRLDMSPNNRKTVIGNIHVACTYYFGVILVTRQFLIQHIMPQLRSKSPTNSPWVSSPDNSGKVAELAQVCIDSATYMAQMCNQASEAGLLLGNMCILKAWLFVAGLVLGFSLLLDQSADVQYWKAFNGLRQILSSMGRLSPQAAQYFEILESFSDAICEYREGRERERAKSRPRFVERILSVDRSSGNRSSGAQAEGQCYNHEAQGVEFRSQSISQLPASVVLQPVSANAYGSGPVDPVLNLVWGDVMSFIDVFGNDEGAPV